MRRTHDYKPHELRYFGRVSDVHVARQRRDGAKGPRSFRLRDLPIAGPEAVANDVREFAARARGPLRPAVIERPESLVFVLSRELGERIAAHLDQHDGAELADQIRIALARG